jgi:hypothetical protein
LKHVRMLPANMDRHGCGSEPVPASGRNPAIDRRVSGHRAGRARRVRLSAGRGPPKTQTVATHTRIGRPNLCTGTPSITANSALTCDPMWTIFAGRLAFPASLILRGTGSRPRGPSTPRLRTGTERVTPGANRHIKGNTRLLRPRGMTTFGYPPSKAPPAN